jgi:hypothetical protein
MFDGGDPGGFATISMFIDLLILISQELLKRQFLPILLQISIGLFVAPCHKLNGNSGSPLRLCSQRVLNARRETTKSAPRIHISSTFFRCNLGCEYCEEFCISPINGLIENEFILEGCKEVLVRDRQDVKSIP